MPDQPDQGSADGGKEMRETSIVRVMTSTSMRKHPTAFSNTYLPALQGLLDVETMNEHLAPLIQPLAGRGRTPRVVYARLLAYKKGNRGVIRYEVAGAEPDTNLVVYGKLYPDPGQAERVYLTMLLLWNRVYAGSDELGIPEPLGCIPDLSMLVYVPVEGELLDEVITSDRALRSMELAGAWIGTLHRQKLPIERRLQLLTELSNVQAWAVLIGQKYPDVAEAAMRIARHLQDGRNDLQLATDVPIHKDFHYGHIVVDNGLKVIDFDEMRLGDPNFDLAHFCANLHLLAYRKKNGPFQFSTLQSAFLHAYAQATGWMPNERFVYFYAYTSLKIAKQLCTMRGLRPRPEGEEQHRQVRVILEQGLAALPRSSAGKLSGQFATLVMQSLSQTPPQK